MEVVDYHPHFGLINEVVEIQIDAKIPQDVENIRIYFGSLLMTNVTKTDNTLSLQIPPCKDLVTLPIVIVYDDDTYDDREKVVGGYTFVKFIDSSKKFPKINRYTMDVFTYQLQSGFMDNAHETIKRQDFNINYIDPDGKTNMHHAASSGNIEAFQFLKNYGANAHILDYMDNSILHDAVIGSNSEIISSLLKSDIDINCKNSWGDTSLHFAAAKKDKNVYLLLLKHGANPNEKNKSGKIPNDFWQESYELGAWVIDTRVDGHRSKKRKT